MGSRSSGGGMGSSGARRVQLVLFTIIGIAAIAAVVLGGSLLLPPG